MRVDSGAEAGYSVLPLYDPMIAKLIVWDVDREASTRRMLRALNEYEIGGLKTLIPFHKALLRPSSGRTARPATTSWRTRNGSRARRPMPGEPPGDDEDEPKVERDYAVEVSGRKFDVKVIGAAFAGGAVNGAAPRPRPQGAQALRAQEVGGGGPDADRPRRCRATCGRSP